MSDIVKTETIKHQKFTIPIPWNKTCGKTVTYYIAPIPTEGLRSTSDFQIHEKISGNDEGYGGSTLKFLMEDGTIEEVKGPFYQHEDSTKRILWDILTGQKR
jgi:hypothetical protein